MIILNTRLTKFYKEVIKLKARILTVLLALVLGTSLLLAACAAPALTPSPTPSPSPSPSPTPAPSPTAEVYQWKLQDYAPAGSTSYVERTEPYIKAVEQASGGRIQIKHFAAGELVPSFEVHGAVGEGIIEMGYSSSTYDMGSIPSAELLFGWPWLLESVPEFLTLQRNFGLNDVMREAYAEHNLHYIAYHTGPYYGDMMSTKELTKESDVKGLKIRTFGTLGNIYEELGGSVVQVPAEEIYTALATGVIDACCWSPLADFYDFGLHEVCQYYVLPPALPILGTGFLINLELYNSLPDDLKTILDMAGEEAFVHYYAAFYQDDMAAWEDMSQNYGVTKSIWTDETIAKFRERSLYYLDQKASTDDYFARGAQVYKDYLTGLGRI